MRVLAFDFDGVIADTACETFVIAARTYLDLRPRSSLAPELSAAAAARACGALGANRVFAAFVRLMPLGNRAEDFAVALGIVEEGAEVRTQEAYDAAYAATAPAWRAAFHERFYEVRAALIREDEAAWRALQRPFGEVVGMIRRRSGDAAMALVTARDRTSVRLLLEEYGIAEVFPDSRLLDKDTGVEKTAHLRVLRSRVRCAYAGITFVDDKVNHLERVAPLGVRCALAGWGFNGEAERRTARERGFAVLELATVDEQLFG